ncbi:hypothetical protein BN137_2939 [Cronobacter condimenti 1330]|uniref:Uncharacterized protein n=1 Tax=Cronobacter condimenti 1330 TaxID=1073999 RepID=K8AH47_9ENTR|nr:hypothetical protein [Cronobacter condimenti]CCJ73562.1 hypothetical protein BN137_2939 [Cronobacter condimenti 1330]
MLKPSDYAKAEGYNELTHAIGSGPAGQLIAHTVRALGVEDKEMLGNLLKVECKKLAKLAGHFERLRPAHPGAANTEQTQEQAIEDAAQWIAGASNSAAISAPLIKSYLNHYLTFDFSISSIVDVDELHRRVALGPAPRPAALCLTTRRCRPLFQGENYSASSWRNAPFPITRRSTRNRFSPG